MNVQWLGVVNYDDASRLQNKLAAERQSAVTGDALLLLEHPPTITIGRSGKTDHIIADESLLRQAGITVVKADRGGDVTYHGPGQLVGYPIFDLNDHGKDLHLFLRSIESALIASLAEWGIEGRRFQPHTGVWVGDEKIAAIGIKVSRWVTTHGFALNVDPNMDHFKLIVPCGIRDFGVTSLARLMKSPPTVEEAAKVVGVHFARAFQRKQAHSI